MHRDLIRSFHRNLHRWYREHGRKDLPWRNTGDAYAIYISEIMLQQTQVKTVLECYYHPFLMRFPTVAKLAAAKQDEVLQTWQGLGYYNRALNLHKAAQQCGKTLPESVEGLIALPGIGRNTAHAVAAFAYRHPVAVMEANVRRVLSRIFALPSASEEVLWSHAQQLLDTASPFDYNQAMMDIGSMICRKREPLCHQCPAQDICKGKAAPELYPAPKQKKTVPVRKKRIVVFRNHLGQYYAVPRSSRFLNGLYHFVETDREAQDVRFGEKLCDFSKAQLLDRISQQYSHFTLDAEVLLIPVAGMQGKGWYSLGSLKKLPVSMAEQKILKLLAKAAI